MVSVRNRSRPGSLPFRGLVTCVTFYFLQHGATLYVREYIFGGKITTA